MKVSVSFMVLVASCEAFVVQDGANHRVATELYKYRPTKWTPQYGATGGSSFGSSWAPGGGGAAVATPPPPAPAPVGGGTTMDDLAKQWAAMNSESGMAPAPAPVAAPPAPSPPAFAGASSGGIKDSYAVTRWSPRTGSHPMTVSGKTVGKWSPPASANAAAASPVLDAPPPPPPAAPAAPTGPSMADLALEWASVNSDHDGAPPKAAAAPAAPAAPATPSFASTGSGPKNLYSVTKWSPQGGSSPGAPAGWTPAGSAPAPAAAAPAPADPMADLAAQWAAINKE